MAAPRAASQLALGRALVLACTAWWLQCDGATQAPASAARATPLTTGPGELASTAERPQLSKEEAERRSVVAYLARGGSLDGSVPADHWDPTAGVGDTRGFSADYRVSTAGPYTSVQAAITAAVAAGGRARRYIEVEPGTYREVVCVPPEAPPITLYGRDPDASHTVIVHDSYSGKPKSAGVAPNPCSPASSGDTIGTSGSTTFSACSAEFHAKNLSFVNDADETAAVSPSVQAVALTVQGDRSIFEGVRVLGNQDSLFLKSRDAGSIARSFFRDCYVEGDTDFIFGRGTAVLDHCTVHSLTSRTAHGVVLAPSTDSRNAYGILVIHSTFTADAGAAAESTHLGRAWDEGQVDVATYAAQARLGAVPNGQATVRDSILGPHIQRTAPWRAAATTARPYDSLPGLYPANRLDEFKNSGPGSGAL